jgi:hypothetical protein
MKRGSKWLAVVLLLGAPPLAWGAGPPSASTAAQGNPYAIRDHKVDPKLSPAARARAQRAADIKRRHDLKKSIEQVQQAKSADAGQPGSKGGAK